MTRRLLLAAMAAQAVAQSTLEARHQTDTFNAFAKAYNLMVQQVTLGAWPLRDLKTVQRRWRDLQALPGWPKEKRC